MHWFYTLLKKMDLEDSVFTVIVLLLLVASNVLLPGLLIIFIFNRSLFLSLTTIKLILLSLSFTMPLFILNVPIIISKIDPGEDTQVEETVIVGVMSAMLMGIIYYTSIVICLFLSIFWPSLKLIFLVAVIALFELAAFLSPKDPGRKEKDKSTKKM